MFKPVTESESEIRIKRQLLGARQFWAIHQNQPVLVTVVSIAYLPPSDKLVIHCVSVDTRRNIHCDLADIFETPETAVTEITRRANAAVDDSISKNI